MKVYIIGNCDPKKIQDIFGNDYSYIFIGESELYIPFRSNEDFILIRSDSKAIGKQETIRKFINKTLSKNFDIFLFCKTNEKIQAGLFSKTVAEKLKLKQTDDIEHVIFLNRKKLDIIYSKPDIIEKETIAKKTIDYKTVQIEDYQVDESITEKVIETLNNNTIINSILFISLLLTIVIVFRK